MHFREFFQYGGVLDLLFHPLETSFTLPELEDLAWGANLSVLGVYFPSVTGDLEARRRFRAEVRTLFQVNCT